MFKFPEYSSKLCKFCETSFIPYHPARVYCPKCQDRSEHYPWWSDHEPRLKKLLASAKNRAKAKKLKFDLTLTDLLQLWEQSNGSCALTGRVFDLSRPEIKGQPRPDAPSVDRIIPSKGYTRENCRLITYHMNVALSEFGVGGFERLIAAYRNMT